MLSGQLYPGLRALGAADGRAAAKKKTNLGVIAFNALALAGFAAPGLLMFASAGPSVAGNPVWAGLSLAAMLAGYASLFVSMLRFSHGGRADFHFATLFILGLTLVAAPLAAIVVVGPFG